MRGDGRVFIRRNSPFFWCAFYAPGRGEIREVCRHRKTGAKLLNTEDNRPEAERYLRDRVHDVEDDRRGVSAFVGPQQTRVTVSEILDDLISEYKLGGKRRIPREVDAQMKSHLKRVRLYFGHMRAIAVRRSTVQQFIALLTSQGKKNSTINRSLQLLGQAYAIAATADPPKLSRALKVPKLDESDNVRKGKFTKTEAQLVISNLPSYMADVARFAYETGARAGEILKLQWSYLDGDAICVPSTDTKSRKRRSIVITTELEDILARRRAERVDGCDLIFHHDGKAIRDYRKCWHTACVLGGLGRFYCRTCKDEDGNYNSVLDAERKCLRCHRKWESPKFEGRFFHDFRRSAAHEMWKAGSTVEECMEVTGHATSAMFKRYADLFTEDEKRARQREVQERRRAWRDLQPDNLIVMRAGGRQ